jgi:Gti1/Pac2 family transcription factor
VTKGWIATGLPRIALDFTRLSNSVRTSSHSRSLVEQMSSGPAALQPTFTGHVATTNDALILFEACLTGQLSHVPRRPHDRERNMLIRSGCVFIYEENASGIKRWTDGVTWSPSRILGNFLVYRELDKPFPPGEKKRAMKKNSRARLSRPGEPYPRPDSNNSNLSPPTPASATFSPDRAPNEMERSLIGSLVDSYGFKSDGLVKKTMSVTVQGVTHHLVSYYSVGDVVNGQLRTPSQTESLNYVRPRPELTSKQSFRSPLEDSEDIEGIREHNLAVQAPYGYRPPQVAHSGYMPSSGPYYSHGMYPPGANHPVTSAGYPPGTTAIAGNFMLAPVSTPQMGHRNEEYSQYQPPAFNRPYEPLNTHLASNGHGSNMGPASASPIPSSLHLRNTPHHVSLYPQASPQSRTAPHQSPVSMESRTPTLYSRSSYSVSNNTGQQQHPAAAAAPPPPQSSTDHHRRAMHQSSPILKHESRDSDHMASNGAGSSSGGYGHGHDRPHFYMSASNNGPLGHHGSYHHSAAGISSWPAPAAAQQHI